jgi:hypothetical protein
MNSIARNLTVYEGGLGGCLVQGDPAAKQPTKQPLNNLEKWIESSELESLADISQQAANKALRSSVWRGAHLDVREVASNVGRGGKMLQVHVDSLPLDLREKWYLSRGIDVTKKPETGALVAIDPKHEDKINDAAYQKQYQLAVFKHNLIKPIVAAADCHERARHIEKLAATEIMMPGGKVKRLTKQTIYNWINAYKDETALSALMRKTNSNKGTKLVRVTRSWDNFFANHIDEAAIHDVADELTTYIRSMWAAGSAGKHAIAEHSTTRLIEMSRDLSVVAFERLELGSPSDRTSVKTQFGLCRVNPRRVEDEKEYKMMAVKDRDNRAFQDHHVPTARRDYSSLKPRQIIVGDVHPVDIMMHRPDGTEVYPKAIAWFDPATNEIHMTFAMLQEGEGIRQEHIAMSFIAMVEEWGMPAVLYLDNGSEYKDSGMLEGLTRLSQLIDGFGVRFMDENNDQVKRAIESREAVIRSTPYNAKGKPKIEGAFGNLEKVFFSAIEGWTGGDRMNRKTHQKGKKPQAYSGDMSEFLETMTKALDWYHKRPQRGMLKGKSPNEALRGFIDDGWTKTVLSRPEVLELAFGKEVERTPDRGRISYKPRRGEALYFYHEALHWHQKVVVRIADWKPDHAFIFEKGTGKYICTVTPEEAYDVLDPRGAQELARRKKAFTRTISEKRKNTALLSLVDEMERHAAHLPDAPEAPIGNVIDAGILDRLAEDAAKERQRLLEDHQEKAKRKPVDQWKTTDVHYEFLPEDE